MPPKRDPRCLQAIADGPGNGWLEAPVARRAEEGLLSGPHLAAFLWLHQMPMSHEQVLAASGLRLWRAKSDIIPPELLDGNQVRIAGVQKLVMKFNHGFRAPQQAQRQLVEFAAALPGGVAIADALRQHYDVCASFRETPDRLADPPSHLDFFKDDRVAKVWRQWDGPPMPLLVVNSLLRVWRLLMPSGSDANNISRDALVILERARLDMDDLHRSIDIADLNAEDADNLRCFWNVADGEVHLNFMAFAVFMCHLPGPLARKSQSFDCFFATFGASWSSGVREFVKTNLIPIITRCSGGIGIVRNRVQGHPDHLYIMQYAGDHSVVKIGRSQDVELRRRQLESAQNFFVVIVKVYAFAGCMEHSVHNALESYRSTDGAETEWFKLDASAAVLAIDNIMSNRADTDVA